MSTISLSGCGFHSENQLKQTLENALEAKYDEEFVCLDVWGNGGSSYWGVCAPEKNHDIRFEALFGADGHIAEEGYYAACVAEKIEEDVQKELENVFNDFYLHSCMTVPLYSRENDDVYAENVRNELFDIDKYVNLANEKWKDPPCISFALCINSSSENKLSFDEEYENLYKIFTQIEKSGIGTIPYIRFLPKNVYSQCTDYFEAGGVIKSTFKDMVRNYPIQISNTTTLFVSFQDGKLKLTKDEYIKQRKEVN